MKNSIVSLFLLLLPFLAVAQQQSMTASFDSKSEVIKNIDETSVSELIIFATEDEINRAKEEALKYDAYMTFNANSTNENGKYECVLTFNHKGHHANVYKMLLAFGVQKFVWKEQTYSIDNWFNVFNY